MDLFSPLTLGDIKLANRVVMAPLTRMRAGNAGVPGDLIAEHYAQRSGLGLIVTEGTYTSRQSQGFVGQPGIVNDEQEEGWARVADAVHVRGGKIVMQLMHAGRVTHADVNGGRPVVAPSAIPVDGLVHTMRGKQPYTVPHALSTAEVRVVRDEFVTAARRAVAAGLDGVEIHGANGYLLHEFLASSANDRNDQYGGAPDRRGRFVAEVVEAVAGAVGPGKVGLRISPENTTQGIVEADPDDVHATYCGLLQRLRPLGLSYLSVLHREPAGDLVRRLRRAFGGPLLVNSGFDEVTTRAEAKHLIEEAHADAIVVGRAALANPDLVQRWRRDHDENAPDALTFYTLGAKGYTDYPAMASDR